MTGHFPPLPQTGPEPHPPRRCGVEIEFGGLDEETTARVLQQAVGGDLHRVGPRKVDLCNSRLGDISVELDIFLKDKADQPWAATILGLLNGLVPLEVISPPLTPKELKAFNALLPPLRQAGAFGSRDGMFLGFGVHLNPEVGADEGHITRCILSFALLEHWLRQREEVDTTRRLLPFVDPWPSELTSALVEARPDTLVQTMEIVARHVDSRNHGLDLLPLFKHRDEPRFAQLFPHDTQTNARPTYHFRLPDSRIDEPDWDLTRAWGHWLLVEEVAQQDALLDQLCTAWAQRPRFFPRGRHAWRDRVGDLLSERHLAGAQAGVQT